METITGAPINYRTYHYVKFGGIDHVVLQLGKRSNHLQDMVSWLREMKPHEGNGWQLVFVAGYLGTSASGWWSGMADSTAQIHQAHSRRRTDPSSTYPKIRKNGSGQPKDFKYWMGWEKKKYQSRIGLPNFRQCFCTPRCPSMVGYAVPFGPPTHLCTSLENKTWPAEPGDDDSDRDHMMRPRWRCSHRHVKAGASGGQA
jgi:hypothetical protein